METTKTEVEKIPPLKRKRGRPKKLEKPEELETERIKKKITADLYRYRYIFRTKYGSEDNVIGIGGCGTYVVLGPSESGKTFLVEQLLAHATCGTIKKEYRIKFYDYILISNSAENSKDFKGIPLGDCDLVIRKPTEQNFKEIIQLREQEIVEGAEAAGLAREETEKWAMARPIVLIVDDSYGALNMTTPGNQVAKLATQARHLGIYMILILQYIKQAGPLIKDNARAIITLSSGYKDHKHIIFDYFGYIQNKLELSAAIKHNTYKNNFVVYYLNWGVKDGNMHMPAKKIFLHQPIKDYIATFYSIPSESEREDEGENVNEPEYSSDEYHDRIARELKEI